MSDAKLPEIGRPAPEFTADAGDGRSLSLGEMLANRHVVLFFYPGNNTPG
jgi:peroxiredoxin